MSLLSFAAETKQELTQLEVQYDYSKYELAALIRMNGAVGILNRQLILNIQTQNEAKEKQCLYCTSETWNGRNFRRFEYQIKRIIQYARSRKY